MRFEHFEDNSDSDSLSSISEAQTPSQLKFEISSQSSKFGFMEADIESESTKSSVSEKSSRKSSESKSPSLESKSPSPEDNKSQIGDLLR